MSRPRTIKVFLTNGDPFGLKIVELSNWNGKSASVPRNELKLFFQRDDFKKPAVYFLLKNEPEENGLHRVYIGEAENLQDRLLNHDNNKDFWQLAVVFSGDCLNKAHVKYLESLCVDIAKQQKRCVLENRNDPNTNSLSESDRAEMEEFLDNISLILSALGYPILSMAIPKSKHEQELICKRGNAVAHGRLVNNGFEVFKGSTATKNTVASFSEGSRKLREFLISEGVLSSNNDELYVFESDYTFNSPSAASDLITGNSTSGWKKWKNINGKTLEEITIKS